MHWGNPRYWQISSAGAVLLWRKGPPLPAPPVVGFYGIRDPPAPSHPGRVLLQHKENTSSHQLHCPSLIGLLASVDIKQQSLSHQPQISSFVFSHKEHWGETENDSFWMKMTLVVDAAETCSGWGWKWLPFREWLLITFSLGIQETQDYFIISSEKLKHGWTLTTPQYTITHILYFKTQRTVIENTKVT